MSKNWCQGEECEVVTVQAPRELVQQHLDRLNEASHRLERAFHRPLETPGELILASNEISQAKTVFRDELAWLWIAGYPLFTFFPYDHKTGNHVWPLDEP